MARSRQFAGLAVLGLLAGTVAVANGGIVARVGAGPKTMFDTVLAVACLVSAALFVVRYRHSHDSSDAAFAYGWTLVGLGGVIRAFAQTLHAPDAAEALTLAFALSISGLGIAALAALEIPRGRASAGAGVVLYGVIVATAVLVATVAGLSASEIQQAVESESARNLILDSTAVPWVTTGLNAVVAAALVLAAYACRLRARTEGERLSHWLAIGFAILASGRLYLLLFPGSSGTALHLHDLCRMVGYSTILGGLISWQVAHWRNVAVTSVLEAQQRAAATLHDGIAQDLALLSAQSEWLAKRSADSEDLAFVATVAQHALTESRRTISRLRGFAAPELSTAALLDDETASIAT